MKKVIGAFSLLIGGVSLLQAAPVLADQASTIAALRMSGNITGGLLPTSSAQFASMVTSIEAGNYQAAAMTATNTPYFASTLARRLAKEMQNVTLSSSGVSDSDASTFVLAHLLYGTTATNTGVDMGISGLWSDNVTCLVDSGGKNISAFLLTPAELAAVDWQTSIVCTPGQTGSNATAVGKTGTQVAIPVANVGGYMTLSLENNDTSFAQNAFTAGTNLRGIEYLYELSTGASLAEMAVLDNATTPQEVAPFVPENDPNFLVGQGQAACISCHGGGAQALNHGYSTLVDLFNYDTVGGFEYIAAPTTATMKSLGSAPTSHANVASCLSTHSFPTVGGVAFTTCNPDSLGASTTHAWDLSSWSTTMLPAWGWKGSTSGVGLNSLGVALGQSNAVYLFMTQRVIGEICPLGTLATNTAGQAAIANEAQTGGLAAADKDSLAYIVASVASDPSCR
jgi:hypothetical protein